MKLLFVVPYTPTPIRTRPYNLVRGLARRGHSVMLATLWESEQERAALEQLRQEGISVLSAPLRKTRSAWNVLHALPTRTPLQAVYCWQPQLFQLIRAALTNSHFDSIHIEHLRGARYGLLLRAQLKQLKPETPIVWDSVDCISYLFEQAASKSFGTLKRILTRFELPRTVRYESHVINQFDRVLVTSPVDAAAFRAVLARSPHASRGQRANTAAAISNLPTEIPAHDTILVLPNGVDLIHFTPSDSPRDLTSLVFSGKMSYHANVTAALHLVNEIMPLVWKERPDVCVQIVGKDPPASLAKLSVGSGGRVVVTGTVPDVRPYLQTSSVSVAPIVYGAGIQNKILEAMACATPVVTSPHAMSALQARDGAEIVVARDAEEFARQLLHLLVNAELRQRIGEAGRRYVERCHDWNEIVAQLEDIHLQLVENPTKAPSMATAVSAPSTHS